MKRLLTLTTLTLLGIAAIAIPSRPPVVPGPTATSTTYEALSGLANTVAPTGECADTAACDKKTSEIYNAHIAAGSGECLAQAAAVAYCQGTCPNSGFCRWRTFVFWTQECY